MIEVDISNIWCGLSLPDLLAIEKEVAAAHEQLTAKAEAMPQLALDGQVQEQQLDELLEAARSIRERAEVCVIAASGELCPGIQAAVELLGSSDGPQLLFTGDTLSTRRWNDLNRQLEGRDFCLLALSPTGTTPESAIAFRGLRWLMERRYGTEEAAQRIFAVSWEDSPLCQMAKEHHWKHFPIAQGVTGSCSVLSPVGLLPMAVAGIDIKALLQGAERARQNYELRSFENPLWLYAGARNALYRRGRHLEFFGSTAPELRAFGAWWRQLFAASESRGIFPAVVEYPRDAHCMGGRIREAGDLFATLVRFEMGDTPYVIGSDVCDLDGLNALAGKTLEELSFQASQQILAEYTDAGVPVITMDWGRLDENALGEVFVFLELASILSAFLCGCLPDEEGDAAVKS